MNFNPEEIRTQFNKQYYGHGGPEWRRLNLSTGPVLARRNVGHVSSPIYIAVLDNDVARHWMVTMKRQLKSNGSSHITAELRNAWSTLIGYTESEFLAAKKLEHRTAEVDRLLRLYEQGPS